MTMDSLFGFIQWEMSIAGFRLAGAVGSSKKRAYFVLGDELKNAPLSDDYPYSVLTGYCVEAAVVPHGNQAEGDASYSLEIREWKRGSSKRIDKVKLPKWLSEATLRARMAPLIEKYKKMIDEKELENIVSELLEGRSSAV